jgi:cytochrome oxidase Cu insertion factor (SCO1/SenC/PrrC family)
VVEDFGNPGFWFALTAGIACLALFVFWLANGARVPRRGVPNPGSQGAPQNGESMLKEGSKAPDFTVLDDHGSKISLRDFRGKKTVVLFFYPKANTPG